jgi:hypothetical protein
MSYSSRTIFNKIEHNLPLVFSPEIEKYAPVDKNVNTIRIQYHTFFSGLQQTISR